MKHGALRFLLATASMAALSLTDGIVTQAAAQEAGGSVTGSVRRDGGTRNFSGVDVTIVELGVSVETDTDGRFRLTNVPAGTYTLELSFLGEVLETRQITVGADTLALAISVETQAIIVTGARGALASARAQERSRDNLTSVVTADDIGNFADQNVAESLQRIPGASIQRNEGEGRTPAIRGLSEGFVTVTLDGTRLGSRTDGEVGDSRAVSLDVFSSDLLNGIEVSKTLLPNQDADAIAGSVNLRSLSAFDRGDDSFALRFEQGYQEKSEDYNPRLSADFTQIVDMGDLGEFGIAGGFSWQQRRSLVDTVSIDNGFRSTVDGTAGEIVRIYNNTGVSNNPPTAAPPVYVPGTSAGWVDPGNCATVLQTFCNLAADGIYSPNVIDYRADPAERTRFSANLNFQWRPTPDDEFFLRGNYAYFQDDDVRNRQTWDLGPDVSLHEEIIALTPTSGIFADVDTEKRYRFTQQEDTLYSFALGGEHNRGSWTFDYQLDYSMNESDIPSIEARFRERDIIVAYTDLGIENIQFRQLPNVNAAGANPTVPGNFELRFLTAYDFFTEDEIVSGRVNVRRDFDWGDRAATVRFGVKYTERDRFVDVTRFRVNPPTVIPTLANFPLEATPNSSLSFLFNPQLGALESFANDLLATGTRQTSGQNPGDAIISQARDYTATETVWAGYAMIDLELTDTLDFIGGVRVEQTTWETAGFVANRINYDEGTGGVSLTIRNNLLAAGVTPAQIMASSLGPRYTLSGTTLSVVSENALASPISGENDYTNVFANLNLRWEPIDNLVIRASFTQGIQRPNFDEASANAEYRLDETTDVTALAGLTTIAQVENVVRFFGRAGTQAEPLRDPTLDPLLSNNYDLSVSWYPNGDTFFQVALFHKDISDFIVRIISNNPAQFGLSATRFNVVETYINGEAAWVQGVELSYAQNYTFLPGILSGLFFAGNVTLADSEQEDGVSGRTLTFQDQADVIGNVSLGWENERFSFRWSGNYVGERLSALNGGLIGLQFPASDVYEQERWSMDVNIRYNIDDRVQIYFDGININDAEERRFFQGGGATGPVLNRVENYGSTYQVGFRARF